MKLKDLEKEYDKLQEKYGAEELTSIYNGGCSENPDICFVFMNPTGRNIASSKTWTVDFSKKVYENVTKHKYFITNLGKCTQVDARVIPNSVYKEFLELLKKEIEIINPKVIILFGNQVSSIVLNEKISVSTCRKKEFVQNIAGKDYKFYAIYYPVGNGRFNIDKSIEDIKYIQEQVL